MKPPKPGTLAARVVELLAARPGLITMEICQAVDVDVSFVGPILRAGLGTRFRRVEVPQKGTRNTHRWFLPTAGEPPVAPETTTATEDDVELAVEPDPLKAALREEEILREWRSQVENALGLDEDNHTGIKATLKRVENLKSQEVLLGELLKSLGATRENAVDVLEELQRATPGAVPTSSSPVEVERAEAACDAWRSAHEQLARKLAEAARR